MSIITMTEFAEVEQTLTPPSQMKTRTKRQKIGIKPFFFPSIRSFVRGYHRHHGEVRKKREEKSTGKKKETVKMLRFFSPRFFLGL